MYSVFYLSIRREVLCDAFPPLSLSSHILFFLSTTLRSVSITIFDRSLPLLRTQILKPLNLNK
jgi:hypothetical protein